MDEGDVFRIVGEEGFTRLVAAFYRQIPTDDILGPLYPADDFPAAEQRLRDFLLFRFGGQTAYLEQRGHPRLRMRHAPFAIGQAARDRWVLLMSRALEESKFPDEVQNILQSFFTATATFMINRPD